MKKKENWIKRRWRLFVEMVTGEPDENPNCPAFWIHQNYDDWDYGCELGGFKHDTCRACAYRFLPNIIMRAVLYLARKKLDREIEEQIKDL